MNSYILAIMSIIIFVGIWFSSSRVEGSDNTPLPANYDLFKEYWYDGKAELTRYDLEQARYGEIHKGNAVLIFVTEDFLTDKQVKHDYGSRPAMAESVLKLNFTRRFYTGIYPYSMMTSIFSPVTAVDAHAYKISTTSQEWCGHTYMQVNKTENDFAVKVHSYFQNEADQQFSVSHALLEDEVWSKIRLNPELLPTGEIEIIPGTQFLRLSHKQMKIEKASASMNRWTDQPLSKKPLKSYRIDYADLKRSVEIIFETEFPFTIVAWEEETVSGFNNPKPLRTRAVKTNSIKLDYWKHNSVADSTYRQMLGDM